MLGLVVALLFVTLVLLVMIARPAAAQVPASSTTTTTVPGLIQTTPDTPEGRCQWERGGQPENPPRACEDPLTVVNLAGDRIKVTAVCETGVPCIANGNAQEVRVTNGPADPASITVGATPSEGFYALALLAGLGSGVAFGRWAVPL